MDNRNDGIDALVYAMHAAGTTISKLSETMVRFAKLTGYYIGKLRVKHRHPRHKQIERARAMMGRGQKGK